MPLRFLKHAFLRSLPMLAGYLAIGIGFGLSLSSIGYGVGWAAGMSILIYAGSMQYVAVGLIAGGASLPAAALAALTVNFRILLYSVSMYPLYAGAGWRRFPLVFTITDESYSLLCDGAAPSGQDPNVFRLQVSLFGYLYWITGSVLGSLLGSVLPFDTRGIEFSMTALFITVLVDQWAASQDHRPAVLGITATLLSLMLFGEEMFLVVSILITTAALLLMRPQLEKEESPHD